MNLLRVLLYSGWGYLHLNIMALACFYTKHRIGISNKFFSAVITTQPFGIYYSLIGEPPKKKGTAMNKHSDKNDQTLVELTLLGEESAYEELVARHRRAVMGTAFKVTNNTYSAEDASQDAFVSAWMNLSSLQNGERFGSWVCAIAKNCARTLDAHYHSTVPDISLDLLINCDLSDEDSEWLTLRDDYSDLHEAVEALSEKVREAVKLHYFEDKSVAEISKLLSLPVGTVKWRLSEGRKQLRKGFGIMEKTYDEKETLVSRVMRQVEHLKLWKLKSDQNGFEDEYKSVLSAVERLDDSKEKSFMLADTLLMGWWWLPGEKHDEMFARIKKAAEDGHNDEAMQSVAYKDRSNLDGQEKIDFMEKKQIPYYREHNFPKTLACVIFWLGHEYCSIGNYEKGIECYKEVMKILSPADVYYANAKSAIDGESRAMEAKKDNSVINTHVSVTGEVYKTVGNRLYFWEQPGYGSDGMTGNSSLFWHLSACDSIMLDKDMRVGDKIVSSDGQVTLTYLRNDGICDTPTGHFENCSVYVCEGEHCRLTYSETWMCEGVGIVRQIVTRFDETHEWVLSAYRVSGGEGLLPFAQGNRWEYAHVSPDTVCKYERENIFEVTAAENGTATVSCMCFTKTKGYCDTWEGKMREATDKYYCGNSATICDIRPSLNRAAELAVTKRQKIYSSIVNSVMNRIYDTDPAFNPDYTEKGRWNFFSTNNITLKSGRVKAILGDHFEWKEMSNCDNEGYKVLYSFLMSILQDATGCLWSDEWVDGYTFAEKKIDNYVTKDFKVTGGETVATPAGTFENCRHIKFDFKAWGYFSGRSDYWFAPGVGVVKFEHPFGEGQCALWHLTDYRKTGEGYFPISDGMFRRYEPDSLGDGWHGSVEFTADEEDGKIVVFENTLGTQDRANYEKSVQK